MTSHEEYTSQTLIIVSSLSTEYRDVGLLLEAGPSLTSRILQDKFLWLSSLLSPNTFLLGIRTSVCYECTQEYFILTLFVLLHFFRR